MVELKVSVTKGDDDAERMERLNGIAAQMREERLPVLALHDRLDVLGVNWKRRPYTDEVVQAMRLCAMHGAARVNHYVRGRLLLSDTDREASRRRDYL